MDKIKYLARSVDYDAEINMAIQHYYLGTPNISLQEFTELAVQIETIMINRHPMPTNEFVNAIAHRETSFSDREKQLMSEIEGLRKRLQKPPRRADTGYCWTHGVCAHDSSKCRSPAEGHRNDSTIENKLGGRYEKKK
jgi:hypothetical protein